MSADRELLELAAKAAGIKHVGPGLGGVCLLIPDPEGREYPTGWNPLEDDGDALRLAVKLRLQIDVLSFRTFVGAGRSRNSPQREREYVEDHKPDDMAATRRAIVRAAAEIGRSMP